MSMGLAGFGPVVGGDGSPQLRYVLAHAVATMLLLITLVAAGWQFVAWVAEPPACLADSPRQSSSSPATAPAVSVVSATRPTASYHYSARAKLALSSGECPCPHER